MNSASDLLTRPDTLATPEGYVSSDTTERLLNYGHNIKLPRADPAAPSPDPVMVDALAERSVDGLLCFCALKRAAARALRQNHQHMGGGLIGGGALMAVLMQIEADPAMDGVLDTLADALLVHAGSLVAAVPTTPSAESQTSSRIAAEIDALDLAPADLTLSPKAQHVAEVLELVPPRQPPTPPAVALAA